MTSKLCVFDKAGEPSVFHNWTVVDNLHQIYVYVTWLVTQSVS